jgi:hypothetical protein
MRLSGSGMVVVPIEQPRMHRLSADAQQPVERCGDQPKPDLPWVSQACSPVLGLRLAIRAKDVPFSRHTRIKSGYEGRLGK